MKRILILPTLLILSSLQYLNGQSQEAEYALKVKTLDSTIETLYAVISGGKGESRDWDLFKYLFTPEANLMPSGKNQEGGVTVRYWSAEEYVKQAGQYLVDNGFYEKEIHRVEETFGSVTHVFSTYESYHSSKDEKPFARGINSIQLMNDGTRWWVVNIYWTGETQDNPIPSKYLND
ncbi:MAG: hypothetical protein AAFN93_04335 [Bacteroidota bacterium]